MEGRELGWKRRGDVTRFGLRKDAGRNAMPLDPCSNVLLEQTTHPLTTIYPLSKSCTCCKYFQAHLLIMYTFLPWPRNSGISGLFVGCLPIQPTCSLEVGMQPAERAEGKIPDCVQ